MAEIKTIEDLSLDDENTNAGTERGAFVLETSLRRLGAGRSILVDRNGKAIAGNKTLEKAVELGLDIEVVHTKGDKLVVVVRDDLDLDTDARARELSIADNRAAEVSLSWRTQLIEELRLRYANLKTDYLFTNEELARAGEKLAKNAQGGGGGGDGAKMVQCPKCGEKFAA